MKIRSVIIEGMHNVIRKEYTFSNMNYLHGKNGAGKSTVLSAIQLALLGYIPGNNKKLESIFRHSNNHTMAVTLNIDPCVEGMSDITVRRVWTSTSKGVNSSVDIVPDSYDISTIVGDLETPIFNFNEFIGMTSNKLKDWFISFLPNVIGEIDWVSELTASTKDIAIIDDKLISTIVDEIKSNNASGVDQVRYANELLKSKLTFYKGQLGRIQSTIQSLIYYDDFNSDESEDDIRSKINNHQTLLDEAKDYDRKLNNNQLIQKEIDELDISAESYELDESYIASRDAIASETLKITAYQQNLVDVQLDISSQNSDISMKSKVISGGGVCPYTNSTCSSISELISEYQESLIELRSKIADLENRRDALEHYIRSSQTRIHSHQDNMQSIMMKYSKRDSLKSRLMELPPYPPINPADAYSREINEMHDKLVKIQANAQYNKLIDELTSEKYSIEQSIEAIKAWIKHTDVNGMQMTMMMKPFENLSCNITNRITSSFGADVSAHFHLSEKANSFSFGIIRNNNYIPFDLLSSGEKCLYTLALMMCIIDNSSSKLKIILVDDMFDHLDDNNVNKLFESLLDVQDIQFIFAGVKDCTLSSADKFIIEV